MTEVEKIKLTAKHAETAKMKEVEKLNKIAKEVINASMKVHRALGPGLLESAYESCLVYELSELGLKVETQKPIPVVYRNVKLDCAIALIY